MDQLKTDHRLTEEAHARVAEALRPGDTAIDATAGNGHDTLFLAKQVGQTGKVFAFDIQETAIEATRIRLDEHQIDHVTLIPSTHERMNEKLSQAVIGCVRAVMFNLGYLPGGDHAVTTVAQSTLTALETAMQLIGPGGVISILAYRGHPAGQSEAKQVRRWAQQQSALKSRVEEIVSQNVNSNSAPVLYLVWKSQSDE